MKSTGNKITPKTPVERKVNLNKRPENKDDLDSREREEQHVMGDNITHNRKARKSEGKKRQ